MFPFYLEASCYFKRNLLLVIRIGLVLSCLLFSGSSPALSTVSSSQSNSMKYQRENDSSTLGKQKSFKKPQGELKYHIMDVINLSFDCSLLYCKTLLFSLHFRCVITLSSLLPSLSFYKFNYFLFNSQI